MLKVAFFVNQGDPYIGGMFTFERSILSALEREKLNFAPLVVARARVDTTLAQVTLASRGWGRSPASLDSAIRASGADLVWFLGSHENVATPYVFTVLDLAHRRYPVFPEVTTRGWTFEARERFFTQALPRAFRVVTGTEVGRGELREWYGVPDERIVTAAFPAPTWRRDESVAVTLPGTLTQPYFFYPAQFWPHKNHVTVVRALAELRKHYEGPLKLVFSGADHGNVSHVREEAEKAGVADAVSFLGFVDLPTLKALYTRATALLFPSFFGPDNLPPLEAGAMSCPVIAAELPGSEGFFESAAVLVPPDDEKAWAREMLRMLNESSHRAERASCVHSWATARSPGRYVDRINDVVGALESLRRCWGR